jgi:tetratricopeptide (TPR) repeat protein
MQRLVFAWFAIGFAGICGCEKTKDSSAPELTVPTEQASDAAELEPSVEAAQQAIDESRIEAAESILRQILIREPSNVVCLFKLAELNASRGQYQQAVSLLNEIPNTHPQAGLAALGQAADWSMSGKDYEGAERRYREVLRLMPDANIARRRLAFLLNRQGRRHEAAKLIRQLCIEGDVQEDELRSLLFVPDAIYDDPPEGSIATAGTQLYVPIGFSGQARRAYSENQPDQAAELLRKAIDGGNAPPSVWAFYGRVVTEIRDEEQIDWWLAHLADDVRKEPEYFVAIGTISLNQGSFRDAIGAYAVAIQAEPSDVRTLARLRQAFISLDKVDEAMYWRDRFVATNLLTRKSIQLARSEDPIPSLQEEIADRLERLGRRLEAVIWRAMAAVNQPEAQANVAILNQQRLKLIERQQAFPSPEENLNQLKLADYPLVKPRFTRRNTQKSKKEVKSVRVSNADFQEVATAWDCKHTFLTASTPRSAGFAIYQQMGGGVGVLDYDLDGRADLYFAQGAADPPNFVSSRSNPLYRNTGHKLIEVTRQANAIEKIYSTGITAGDWNQDGFDDIFVANLGSECLLTNNGDGTFLASTINGLGHDSTLLDTSNAIADLTGDGLPDIIQLRYCHDPKLFEQPEVSEDGRVTAGFGPARYQPTASLLLINDAKGGFISKKISETEAARSTSLGLVVANLHSNPGNELFVANDQMPNHLWTRVTEDKVEQSRWIDAAITTGCAFNQAGNPTASMGVTAADFDSNGELDLHVTNFAGEPVSLFLQDKGIFTDRSSKYQLAEASMPVLGFGCQSLDYNNDGLSDIAVTNGHVDDIQNSSAPLKQPFQLFANRNTEFQLVTAGGANSYTETNHIGRAMAVVDLDTDGSQDLIITHLGERSAILLNQTPERGHFIKIRLVGVSSERLPIGSSVTIRHNGQSQTQWLTAGNGYMCRNEPLLHFGIGTSQKVDRVEVIWPNGSRQIDKNAGVVNRELAIVESK